MAIQILAMSKLTVIVVVLSLAMYSSTNSLKIAVLPTPVGSHILSMKTISEVLIARGHQVNYNQIQHLNLIYHTKY